MEAEKNFYDAAAFLQRVYALDKASRAELRHACGKSLDEATPKALFVFYSCYPPKGYNESIYFAVACLACMNVTPQTKVSLEQFLNIAIKDEQSLADRVVRLLNTEYDPEDGLLVDRLMGFARMAKKYGYEIDCLPLVRYLSNWNADSQWVQKRLARACFGTYSAANK